MNLQKILDKNNIYYIDNINNTDYTIDNLYDDVKDINDIYYIDNINNTDYTIDNLYDDVKDINDIYKNIDEILNCQNDLIDTIENNMSLANLKIIESKNELEKADGYFASYKRYQYILYGLAFVGTILILI